MTDDPEDSAAPDDYEILVESSDQNLGDETDNYLVFKRYGDGTESPCALCSTQSLAEACYNEVFGQPHNRPIHLPQISLKGHSFGHSVPNR